MTGVLFFIVLKNWLVKADGGGSATVRRDCRRRSRLPVSRVVSRPRRVCVWVCFFLIATLPTAILADGGGAECNASFHPPQLCMTPFPLG